MQFNRQLILSFAFYVAVVVAGFALLPPEPRGGDLNGDGVVNYDDLKLVISHLGTRIGQRNFDARADVNGDGVIDAADVSLELHWLKTEGSRHQ